ncbi:MAG: thioredoxin domain-containing protein [Magnetospiraceae bacterium]
MTGNLLHQETSPYLLQHKDNPVHWVPWGEDALARAQAENKPILLSVGYAACHWCHVMAHESFEDGSTASLMNDLYVNIKVDREERPDLDSIYQSALAMMGQQGGWPLTMFLTPEAKPFFGGTYFPPDARWGRPGFKDVLVNVAKAFVDRPEVIDQNVSALAEGLAGLSQTGAGAPVTEVLIKQTAALTARIVDMDHGGTQGAPKFPQPSFFDFMWRGYKAGGDAALREGVILTLDKICQGGIYDHIGGGFARYSTDDVWLVPHFEKMLYDNAQLVGLMTQVWRETGSALYATRIAETVDWLDRDMWVPTPNGDGGAYAAALDADSEGVEGKFYVWSEAEVEAILGDDAVMFNSVYNISHCGNWEGQNIPHRSQSRVLGGAETEAALKIAREKLLAERVKRIPPQRDDKVLADWNAMMATSLAEAGAAFDRPAWIAKAATLLRFIENQMVVDGNWQHSWAAGRAKHRALLDDHAHFARAALALFEATGNGAYLTKARDHVALADQKFWDGDQGGYFQAPHDATDLIARNKPTMDGAQPSGNATMARVLARLGHLTGEAGFLDRAEKLIGLFADAKPERALNMPALLSAYYLLARPVQVMLVGEAEDPALQAMRRAVFQAPAPNRVLLSLTPGVSVPDGHPATGKGMVDGKPTAYVCQDFACGLPITDAEALRDALA